MRVVIDTNVFVSAALKQDSLPGVAIYLAQREDTILKSSTTEAELLKVLARPRLATLIPSVTRQWIVQVMAAAEAVRITEKIALCRDTDDDKFLELAVNGSAEMIVSGDKDLLEMASIRGIPILSPAGFVRRTAV